MLRTLDGITTTKLSRTRKRRRRNVPRASMHAASIRDRTTRIRIRTCPPATAADAPSLSHTIAERRGRINQFSTHCIAGMFVRRRYDTPPRAVQQSTAPLRHASRRCNALRAPNPHEFPFARGVRSFRGQTATEQTHRPSRCCALFLPCDRCAPNTERSVPQ